MKLLALFLLVSLAGCGVETSAPEPKSKPPIEIPDEDDGDAIEKPSLLVFGAPWCGPCKKWLPEIDQAVKSRDGKFNYVFYVTTGYRSNELPTQEIADRYRTYLSLAADAYPDVQWAVYRAYFGNALSIPAVVILDRNRKVVYRSRSMHVAEIAARLFTEVANGDSQIQARKE